MRHIDVMTSISDYLRSVGLAAVAPAPDEPVETPTPEALNSLKREASRRHMDHIRHSDTAAILVVNLGRPNAPHYVGPNSFAEIGVAFSGGCQVFLLHGMPDCYADELVAWGVTCLNGDLSPLLDAFEMPEHVNPSAWTDTRWTHLVSNRNGSRRSVPE